VSKPALRRVAILGSTGSIGTSTLSVIERYPERFQVASLAGGRNVEALFSQCLRWHPQVVSAATEELAGDLSRRLRAAGLGSIDVVYGPAGTVRAATLPQVDFVVSAIVGVAGLEATYAAVEAGKPVGLANKEAMVAAGEILTRVARERGVPLK
jgi:1-deoxy-D-xylulose-5-phosphate reductoisomerase